VRTLGLGAEDLRVAEYADDAQIHGNEELGHFEQLPVVHSARLELTRHFPLPFFLRDEILDGGHLGVRIDDCRHHA